MMTLAIFAYINTIYLFTIKLIIYLTSWFV